jgi:dUTP pyrophosphatase
MIYTNEGVPSMGAVIQFRRIDAKAEVPRKAHADDACFDLYSSSYVNIYPGTTAVISTGFEIALPKGYAGLVCSRSGLAAKHRVFVLNAPGMIDAGYRGELKVILYNASKHSVFQVDPGDRVAQLFLQKVPPAACVEVKDFADATTRGAGGFGSSGK